TAPTIAELRDVCGQIDAVIEEVEAAAAEAVEGNWLRRFLALDMAFHLLIIAAAGNARLLKIAKQTKSVALIFQARRGRHTIDFTGFGRKTQSFLKELDATNTWDWFTENKPRYKADLVEPAFAFIAAIEPRVESISKHFIAAPTKQGVEKAPRI
ncbi:MAG: DUF2461 family protein, partial [Planctomycetota bacterium]